MEMEIWDCQSKTSHHKTQALGGNVAGSIYLLCSFLLLMLFVLIIQFKK